MPIECLHDAQSLPTSVVITGIDSLKILDQAFEAVKTFQPLKQEQIAELLKKTAQPRRTAASSRPKRQAASTRRRSIRSGWDRLRDSQNL